LGASIIMRPQLFNFLAKLGVLKLLITEKPQITSAHALVAITAPKNSDYYEQGKTFYRSWLELARLNLFGAPLSLLTDDKEATEFIKKEFDLGDATLVNILRVGYLPEGYQRYKPARIDAKEILISQ
jgi:hypothetical protein